MRLMSYAELVVVEAFELAGSCHAVNTNREFVIFFKASRGNEKKELRTLGRDVSLKTGLTENNSSVAGLDRGVVGRIVVFLQVEL